MSSKNDNSCEFCGQPFYAERITKRYCSDSCRQLSYFDRRSRKSAQASSFDETDHEFTEPIEKHVQQEVIEIDTVKAEDLTEGSSFHKSRSQYLLENKSGRADFFSTAQKSHPIDGRLVLFGVAAAGLLLYNYLNEPKTTDIASEPDL